MNAMHVEVAHDAADPSKGSTTNTPTGTPNTNSNRNIPNTSTEYRGGSKHKHVLRLHHPQVGEVLLECRSAEDMYGWLAQLQRAGKGR